MPAKTTESNPAQRLRGKVAMITGGSSGIGYAIARSFASEGCNLVITGRNEKKLLAVSKELAASATNNPIKVVAEVCDVREPYAVDALFDMVQTRFGHIDILINNAGVSQSPTPIEQISVEMWREMIDINLNGMFYCTRAALPLMSAGGTIINNLSAAAKQVFPQFAAYTASKSGAYGFTLSLRDEMMARGIRVTALMTGATSTDMWQTIMPEASREGMMDVETVARAVLYTVLLPPEANVSELLITPTAGAISANVNPKS
jgi:NAD(P)-dependent dehydrogenase (short-subunit alcohol dehydrogenase family)